MEKVTVGSIVYQPINTGAGQNYGPIHQELAKTEQTLGDYIKAIQQKHPEDKPETPKHSHYFKDISNLKKLDVYRLIDLFEVENPCIQHAIKKLLVAGARGHKDISRDIEDVIDTLLRWKEMKVEDETFNANQKEDNDGI